MSKLVDSTHDWNALVALVTSADGYVGPVTLKDVPGSGRGLFLTEDVEAYTTLVSIPKTALMSWNTIKHHYPQLKSTSPSGPSRTKGRARGPSLNSTQALTMHIYLLRRGYSEVEADSYYASLPQSFDEHPLTWTRSPREALLDYLPPSSKTALKDVEGRCKGDWKAVTEALVELKIDLKLIPRLSSGDTDGNTESNDYRTFVWAWLCGKCKSRLNHISLTNLVPNPVNTRCIHYSLSPSEILRSVKDIDLTLCPIIDFANHSLSQSSSFAVRRDTSDASLNLEAPAFPMKKGDEIFFNYGAHSNTTLLTEYGFVIPRKSRASEDDEAQEGGEAQVDDVMEGLFEGNGNEWKKDMLEASGYWGDWTLHSSPPPAHPSYRVLTALRLLHVSQSEVDQWEDVIFGGRDIISATNEAKMRSTLRSICQQVVDRASKNLIALSTGQWNTHLIPCDALTTYALECVRTLWAEEQAVAEAVIESIDKNEEF